MNTDAPNWYGEAAQSIAPVGVMMASFLLVYTVWFGFAWGALGWILFSLSILLASFLVVKSIQNIKHSKLFENKQTTEGKRINKLMGILSGVSYGILWLAVILLFIFDLSVFIMPIVTLIIGLHFIPQAKIMNRKIDYFVAPLPIISAVISIFLGIQSDLTWLYIYAIASIGGALATSIYGLYILRTYKKMAKENDVSY